MTPKRFEELTQVRIQDCLDTLNIKGEEYARNGDRLHNFKTAARIKGETPEQALWGMYVKHLVSITDIISDISMGRLPNKAVLAEKMRDSINYHLLLEGLIEDRREPIDKCLSAMLK